MPRDFAVAPGGGESTLHAQVSPLLIVPELANRFRWEILAGFVELESGLWDLLQRLEDMESIARQQGMDVERLLAGFGFQDSEEAHNMPSESLDQVQAKAGRCLDEALKSEGMHRDPAMMLGNWMKRRQELEAAVQSRDVQKVRSILDEFTPVTNRFIALLAARLSEVMKESVWLSKWAPRPQVSGELRTRQANLESYRWQLHCHGLVQLPISALHGRPRNGKVRLSVVNQFLTAVCKTQAGCTRAARYWRTVCVSLRKTIHAYMFADSEHFSE